MFGEREEADFIENLWVSDGSVMPTSVAVNPSLTIAAFALRTARHIALGSQVSAGLESMSS